MQCVIDSGIVANKPSLYGVTYTYDACISIIRTARGVPARKNGEACGRVKGARMSDEDGMMPDHVIFELDLRIDVAPEGFDFIFVDPLTVYDDKGRVTETRLSTIAITR